ncbi:MAG TPA: hypothetical protein DCS21_09310 [Gammaproteobacteria bacterium]|nr:hypothetical protein [Gammaproteobacteria bacterium]
MNEKSVAFNAMYGSLVAPLTQVNRFMASQLEQGVMLGLDSLRAYVDLGVAQVKVALKVTDSHSLHEFADSQFAVLSFVGHRVLDDNRAASEWSKAGYCEANRLMRKNLLSQLFKA